MPAFTNTFGGTNIYPADVSYRAVSLTANVVLAWPTEMATSTDVVASIMDVTPSAGSLTITMPPANQVSVGQTALIFNAGSYAFVVLDNDGNTIQSIAPGIAWQLYLTDNTTNQGTWRQVQYGAGTSSPSAAALAGYGLKAIATTLNQSMPVTLLSTSYTMGTSDRARALVWNGGAGTFTLPSAGTVGNDWFINVRNAGTGGLTIATTGGELLNGSTSLLFNPSDSATLMTDGTAWYTIGYGQNAIFAFDFVSIDLTGQTSPYTLSGSNLNRVSYQFSGVLTANMQIIVPNTVQQYWVRNTTSGTYTLTVKTAAGSGVAVVQNGGAILYSNGTDVVQADTAGLSVPVSVSQGGTGATTAGSALVNLGGSSLGIGLFTATNPGVARAAIGAAASGANTDITSLSGLTTALSVAQGGTGTATPPTNGQLLIGNGTNYTLSGITAGAGVSVTNGSGSITIANTGVTAYPGAGIPNSTGSVWGTSYSTTGTGTTVALSASPALTGTPTAPTAAGGTSTTQIATTAFVAGTAFSSALPGQTGNAGKFVTTNGSLASWSFIDLTSSVTGTLPVANGGTGATTAAAARTSLGGTTVGANMFTLVNPSAITFPRFNADNTVSALDAASFRTAIGAGTGGGTVSSVSGTGTVNGLTLTGTVTTSGSLTLGGTLSGVSLTTQVTGTLPVANGGTGATSLTSGYLVKGNGTSAASASVVYDDGTNVGIGTSSPGSPLDVQTNSSALGISLRGRSSDNVSSVAVRSNDGATIYGQVQGRSTDFRLEASSSNILTVYTNSAERMRIDSSGNVGIGTTSLFSGYAGGGPALNIKNGGSALWPNSSGTWNTTTAGGGVTYYSDNNLYLDAKDSASNMIFRVNGATERFRITSTGGITSSDLADAVGYKGLPQNSQTASYTLALSDMGKHISITTGGVVIPANGSVAFPIGSAVSIFNNSGSNQTISITTDTLRQAGTANTGSRTLAQYGLATVVKVSSTVWVISGAGIS